MWFDGWNDLLRVLVMGACGYAGLVLMLRASGKRTLSKMNAFDFVVTVAFGSILATLMLSEDVALAEGLVAFTVLIGLQFVVAWLAVRVRWVERVVKSEPALLAYRGRLLRDALRRERVTAREVHAAVREAGHASLASVETVVLETDGQFSVVACVEAGADHGALAAVSGYDA